MVFLATWYEHRATGYQLTFLLSFVFHKYD